MGRGNAFKIDLDEVFVRAEVMYQIRQSPINLYDTGAFKAAASSCAFALILAFRVLMVVIASLMLFRGRCFEPPDPFTWSQETRPAFRGCVGSLLGPYLAGETKCEASDSVATPCDSSTKVGNLSSSGELMDCGLVVVVGGGQHFV